MPDDLFVQVLDPSGVKIGPEIRWNPPERSSDFPDTNFAYLPTTGRSVLTWSGKSTRQGHEDDAGVFMQLFDVNGARIGAEVRVNSSTDGVQNGAMIRALPNGSFVVAWNGPDGEQCWPLHAGLRRQRPTRRRRDPGQHLEDRRPDGHVPGFHGGWHAGRRLGWRRRSARPARRRRRHVLPALQDQFGAGEHRRQRIDPGNGSRGRNGGHTLDRRSRPVRQTHLHARRRGQRAQRQIRSSKSRAARSSSSRAPSSITRRRHPTTCASRSRTPSAAATSRMWR